MQTSVSSKPLKLLVDSGASICVVNVKSIKIMPEIMKHIISISGITPNNSMKTLGHIPIYYESLNHNFHVVILEDFLYDGIVGNDFLSKFNCKIDYTQNNILISDKVKLTLNFTEPIYTIPPCTETIIECSVSNPEINEGFILDQIPINSLLIANCIVKVKPNGRINVSVVNTSESPVHIDSNLKFTILSLDPLSHVNPKHNNIFYNNDIHSRTEQVTNLLRVSHLNTE